MKPEDLIVRCELHRDRDLWVALCLDFDLAAQANSAEEAKSKLRAQIHGYVRDALTIDREHAAVLLNRKAPLWMRVQWDLSFHTSNLAKKWGLAVKSMFYKDPLPLCAA